MDEQSEKLDDLSARIAKAEAPEGKTDLIGEKEGQGPSRNVGFDFVGSVVGAGVLGFFMDRVFDTFPWCLLGMVVFGFASGTYSSWRAMNKK
jgi:F0F1-type ATP synthase assembly protein I